MVKQELAALKALKEKSVKARGRAARDAWSIGVHLERVRRAELRRAGGSESFTDFLSRDIDRSRASAYRYLRIAEHFDVEFAERYGIDKQRLVPGRRELGDHLQRPATRTRKSWPGHPARHPTSRVVSLHERCRVSFHEGSGGHP